MLLVKTTKEQTEYTVIQKILQIFVNTTISAIYTENLGAGGKSISE